MSIISYPERGKWGKSSWRGNCSGNVYKELFERLEPTIFIDPMVGSGTSIMIARMPKDELAAVLIKEQHNAQSFRKDYRKMRLPFILHEYILLWKKKDRPLLIILGDMARAQYARLTGTWKNIVRATLVRLGGEADLKSVYEAIAQSAPDRIAANANWREKVRQTLNQNASLFKPVARGVWAVA